MLWGAECAASTGSIALPARRPLRHLPPCRRHMPAAPAQPLLPGPLPAIRAPIRAPAAAATAAAIRGHSRRGRQVLPLHHVVQLLFWNPVCCVRSSLHACLHRDSGWCRRHASKPVTLPISGGWMLHRIQICVRKTIFTSACFSGLPEQAAGPE